MLGRRRVFTVEPLGCKGESTTPRPAGARPLDPTAAPDPRVQPPWLPPLSRDPSLEVGGHPARSSHFSPGTPNTPI